MDNFSLGFIIGFLSGDNSAPKKDKKKTECSKELAAFSWGVCNVLVVLFVLLVVVGFIYSWIAPLL